jgi:hypothetical protein
VVSLMSHYCFLLWKDIDSWSDQFGCCSSWTNLLTSRKHACMLVFLKQAPQGWRCDVLKHVGVNRDLNVNCHWILCTSWLLTHIKFIIMFTTDHHRPIFWVKLMQYIATFIFQYDPFGILNFF